MCQRASDQSNTVESSNGADRVTTIEFGLLGSQHQRAARIGRVHHVIGRCRADESQPAQRRRSTMYDRGRPVREPAHVAHVLWRGVPKHRGYQRIGTDVHEAEGGRDGARFS